MTFLTVAAATAQDSEFVQLENGRLLAPGPIDEEIEVVDADTIWIGIHQIRLHGIDAVEPKQECEVEGRPKTWCHTAGSNFLRSLTGREGFRCEIHVRDGENKPWIMYGRYVATCYVGDYEVNRALVESGWAFADENYGAPYADAQTAASRARLGVHAAAELKHPKEWRRDQREDSCTC